MKSIYYLSNALYNKKYSEKSRVLYYTRILVTISYDLRTNVTPLTLFWLLMLIRLYHYGKYIIHFI